ncbi:MAG: hypothetical protein ACK5MA_02345 [Parachlamydiaceae bacterium]
MNIYQNLGHFSFPIQSLPMLLLTRMFIQMTSKETSFKTAMNLHATCKEMKGKLESREFMLPFFKYLNIDIFREPWTTRLETESSISLCKEWAMTPLTVVALDYSNKMERASPVDGQSHMEVALDMLAEIFAEQQKKLRSDLIVHLFAFNRRCVHLRTQADLYMFLNEIDRGGFSMKRTSARLHTIFRHLISASSPIHRAPTKEIVVKIISDQDFRYSAIDGTVINLCSDAKVDSIGKRRFTLEFIPTSIGEVSEYTFSFFHIFLEKRKRNPDDNSVHLVLNNEPAAERLRFEPDEELLALLPQD